MTTKDSPLPRLKAQADKMAALLKKAERGEKFNVNDPAGKIAAARTRDTVKFAVAMDDKILTIEMSWKTIRETTAAGISEYILAQMREDDLSRTN